MYLLVSSLDPTCKGLVSHNRKVWLKKQFVGHQSDSRKVKLMHYINIIHNNDVQLNKPGNL